jgi:DNA modification methylase
MVERIPMPTAEQPYAVYHGDCFDLLQRLPDGSVQCCITSPPYWGLRDYGVAGQLGLEPTPEGYVAKMVEVFREVRRVLRDDGTLWLNLGDSYWTAKGASCGVDPKQGARRGWARPQDRPAPDGLKGKDLIGIPWRVAFALQADGWYLRSDIPWVKRSAMPESVTDRPAKSLEYVFLLSKSERYHFDKDAIKKPAAYAGKPRGGSKNRYEQNAAGMDNREYETRNFRNGDLWFESVTTPHGLVMLGEEIVGIDVNPAAFKGAHFATFPPLLVRPFVRAGCPDGGIVLDPFNGAGTTGLVALQNNKRYIGLELNQEYISMTVKRLDAEIQKRATPLFDEKAA